MIVEKLWLKNLDSIAWNNKSSILFALLHSMNWVWCAISYILCNLIGAILLINEFLFLYYDQRFSLSVFPMFDHLNFYKSIGGIRCTFIYISVIDNA